MKGPRLATVAVAIALPFGVAVAPAAAVAKSNHEHHLRRHLHRRHVAHTVTFLARVVRASASGLVLRRSDGTIVTFSRGQLARGSRTRQHKRVRHHRRGRRHDVNVTVSAGNVVVNILGLQPGVTVQVTESVSDNGTITVTITLPPAPPTPVEASASGVITELDNDALTVQSADGSELRLHMSGDALSALGLQTCDTVDVTYHQDAGILIADTVSQTGTSSAGDCAPTLDVTGAITQISDSSVTVNGDSGPVTVAVDPSSGLTDGFQAGDVVDVTYTQAADGSLDATDIQFVEQDATGTVTSVTTSTTGGSLTITDDNTGQPDAFVASPDGVEIDAYAFTGVSLGDHVDVSYHTSAGQLVADAVSEQ